MERINGFSHPSDYVKFVLLSVKTDFYNIHFHIANNMRIKQIEKITFQLKLTKEEWLKNSLITNFAVHN